MARAPTITCYRMFFTKNVTIIILFLVHTSISKTVKGSYNPFILSQSGAGIIPCVDFAILIDFWRGD